MKLFKLTKSLFYLSNANFCNTSRICWQYFWSFGGPCWKLEWPLALQPMVGRLYSKKLPPKIWIFRTSCGTLPETAGMAICSSVGGLSSILLNDESHMHSPQEHSPDIRSEVDDFFAEDFSDFDMVLVKGSPVDWC